VFNLVAGAAWAEAIFWVERRDQLALRGVLDTTVLTDKEYVERKPPGEAETVPFMVSETKGFDRLVDQEARWRAEQVAAIVLHLYFKNEDVKRAAAQRQSGATKAPSAQSLPDPADTKVDAS
jgi:hypothetical protein